MSDPRTLVCCSNRLNMHVRHNNSAMNELNDDEVDSYLAFCERALLPGKTKDKSNIFLLFPNKRLIMFWLQLCLNSSRQGRLITLRVLILAAVVRCQTQFWLPFAWLIETLPDQLKYSMLPTRQASYRKYIPRCSGSGHGSLASD